jgi:hypothetical protein
MIRSAIPSIAFVLAMLAGCTGAPPRDGGDAGPPAAQAPAPPPPATTNPTPPAGAAETDTARIRRLEVEARAMAQADGCGEEGQCRTAPVGSRPCGGPRTYVVYCATSTDTMALFAKLRELARAEEEYNKKEGMASTCEFREPPNVELSNASCRATDPPSLVTP